MTVITIDANIGAGKTTLLEFLHTRYGLPIDPEPVEKWEPYLADMYRHGRGAFSFQVRVWLDRCWIQEKPNSLIVMERSPYFQANVFVPVNCESGRITASENRILCDMYERAFKMWSPHGMIYLRSSPERCAARIAKRGRESEKSASVGVEYLRRLHDFHESAYRYGIAMGLPIVCVDAGDRTVEAIAADVMEALRAFGVVPRT